jgi:adenosylcobyric acid synthase
VALVPYTRHTLPEEDALHHRSHFRQGAINLALVAYPYASNLDEFDPLVHEEGINVVPLRARESLEAYDAVLLPGSKNTVASLAFLRKSGLAAEIVKAARSGTRIVGVCGGMQLLGKRILDEQGVEGGDAEGLGLLDLVTRFRPLKETRQRTVEWAGGGSVRGYEIHHGATDPGALAEPFLEDGLGWEQDNVLGTYLHGLFENSAFRQHFLGSLGWDGRTGDWAARLDAELDRVARLVVSSGWAERIGESG